MTTTKWLELALTASIMLTVLGFGLRATFQDATYLLRTPKLLLRTVVSMNVVMPLVAALIVNIMSLPIEVNFALLSIAFSPVPPMVQSSQIAAGGRREYVVGLMVAMSLFAIVIVPLAVVCFDHMYGRDAVITPFKVARIMLMTVLGPLLVSLSIAKWFPAARKASHAIMLIAGIMLALSAILLLYGLWPITRTFLGNGVALALAVLSAIGLGVGHWLGGPLASDRTVLAMSTASRHPAVAVAIASSGTRGNVEHEFAIILLYLIVSSIVGFPYQKWRARNAQKTG
jgi:bile acid:Na+ symporter, BASS family